MHHQLILHWNETHTGYHLYYNSPEICLSLFANGRSQFLLDRPGRCLKLFVSTEGPSSYEFASQFGLAKRRKTPTKYGGNQLTRYFVREDIIEESRLRGLRCQSVRSQGVRILNQTQSLVTTRCRDEASERNSRISSTLTVEFNNLDPT